MAATILRCNKAPLHNPPNVNNNDDNCAWCLLGMSRGMKGTFLLWWVTITITHCNSSVTEDLCHGEDAETNPHTQHARRYLICSLKSDGRTTKCSTSRERPYVVSLAFIYILFVSPWGYSWTLPTRSVAWDVAHSNLLWFWLRFTIENTNTKLTKYMAAVQTTWVSLINPFTCGIVGINRNTLKDGLSYNRTNLPCIVANTFLSWINLWQHSLSGFTLISSPKPLSSLLPFFQKVWAHCW